MLQLSPVPREPCKGWPRGRRASLSRCPPPQLVLAEGAHSDTGSQATDGHTDLPPPLERMGGIGDSRPPSFQ